MFEWQKVCKSGVSWFIYDREKQQEFLPELCRALSDYVI